MRLKDFSVAHHVEVHAPNDPYRQRHYDEQDDQRENETDKVPAALGRAVHMEEVNQLNHNLRDSKPHQDEQSRWPGEHWIHHECKRNDRENGAKGKARQVTLRAAMGFPSP